MKFIVGVPAVSDKPPQPSREKLERFRLALDRAKTEERRQALLAEIQKLEG